MTFIPEEPPVQGGGPGARRPRRPTRAQAPTLHGGLLWDENHLSTGMISSTVVHTDDSSIIRMDDGTVVRTDDGLSSVL